MPVKTYPKITVAELAKGDTITRWHLPQPRPTGEVAKIDRRIKRADVTLTSGEVIKHLDLEGTLIVERLVKTQEEKDAEMRRYKLRMLDRAEVGAVEDLHQAQEKIAKDLAQGHPLGYSRLGDLLEAQANHAVWARVAHVSKLHAEWSVEFDSETESWTIKDTYTGRVDNDELPLLTRLEVLDKVRDAVRQELLEFASYTSRSTSVISNAVEDYEREAKAKFVAGRLYFGL